MGNSKIYLEIIREENSCKNNGDDFLIKLFLKQNLNQTMSNYTTKRISSKIINNKCNKLIELLNKSGKQMSRQEVLKKIKEYGLILSDYLLPSKIKIELRNIDVKYLILSLDDHLVHIPWELLFFDNEFLCQRFNMGRLISTQQEIERASNDSFKNISKNSSKKLNMWIIANPVNDLPAATYEGKELFKNISANKNIKKIIKAELNSTITNEKIIGNIRNYNIVHFAGHAVFDEKNPELCGWKLLNGNLTAQNIENMSGSGALPSLIFPNACQSARTSQWDINQDKNSTSFGMVNSFIKAGVNHYIGTLWDIMDEPGSQFALKFYNNLFNGKTIGESVRDARFELIEEGEHACWTSYLLYGDPCQKYIDIFENNTLSGNSLSKLDNKTLNQAKTIDYSNSTVYQENSSQKRSEKIDKFEQNENYKSCSKYKKFRSIFKNKQLSKNLQYLVLLYIISGLLISFFYYLNNEDESQKPDTWTSKTIKLAVIFDKTSNFFDIEMQYILSNAIQIQIQKDYPRIVLIERTEIKIIKEEIDLWLSKYVSPEKKVEPQLLLADILLYLEIIKAKKIPEVAMRLFYIKEGIILKTLVEKFEYGGIIDQKDNLSKNLIQKLKSLYPLRGKINIITDNEFCLNIGKNVGVSINDRFRVVDKDISFKINSIEADTSCSIIDKKNLYLKTGWRVEKE